MPVQFNVSAAIADAARLSRVRGGLSVLKSRIVGTIARRLPVEARRDIQDEYNLSAQRINAALVLRRSENTVELTGKKRGVTFVSYGAKWRRGATLTVTVSKLRGAERWGDAFIATGRNGNLLAFMRDTRARLPLISLYGTSIATALRKPERQERLTAFVRDLGAAEFDRLTKVT